MGAVIALTLLATGCSVQDPTRGRSVSGTIETDEVRVASRYGGRVVKLFAAEGDSLQASQPLVELDAAELKAARWPLARRPMLFETSLPGVFAVGDVRATSVKRVAAAVGEGSVCVQLVHKALAE